MQQSIILTPGTMLVTARATSWALKPLGSTWLRARYLTGTFIVVDGGNILQEEFLGRTRALRDMGWNQVLERTLIIENLVTKLTYCIIN